VVCVANRKGGVGKTTTAVLLAQTLQDQSKVRVAVIDVDPQASATLALGGDDLNVELSVRLLEKNHGQSDPDNKGHARV
jgi:cellulose biosynthesis protein BcsQ